MAGVDDVDDVAARPRIHFPQREEEQLVVAAGSANRTAKTETVVAFLGKGGGRTKGLSDIELIIPSDTTARVQEAHKLLFHVLCEWIDSKVD